jgi:uncharacterized protein YbjT (DUF2867 family)
MRIAIVGGTGTLGRHVVSELADRGHEARVLSRSGEYKVDLTTGAGLGKALEGCAALVDASNASSPRQARQVLVEGSRLLLAAEREAGVGHHVCVSIVGCDQVPMGYYRVKADQELVVENGDMPWSIVQATQFHELVTSALTAAAKFRMVPVPAMRLQTIAAAEVGRAIADVAEGAPRNDRVTVAGPEVTTARDLATTWRRITGRRAILVPLPLPGKLGRALRSGGLTAGKADVNGTVTFAEWLTAQNEARS